MKPPSVLHRLALLGLVSMCAGFYWNLSWPMAIPFITLVCPSAMSVLVARLFPALSFVRQFGIYTGTVGLAELVRNACYVWRGRGLDYLGYDGETQLIALALIVEELLLGMIVIGVIAQLRRRRSSAIDRLNSSQRPHVSTSDK